jgi:hypothetical protein
MRQCEFPTAPTHDDAGEHWRDPQLDARRGGAFGRAGPRIHRSPCGERARLNKLQNHWLPLFARPRGKKWAKLPPQWAGLKFFNVFGRNE